METQKEKRLRLWKARQEAEGYDVSGVTTLQEAEHFFDKKVDPEPPAQHEEEETNVQPGHDAEPEQPVTEETPEPPKPKKPRKSKKAKEA